MNYALEHASDIVAALGRHIEIVLASLSLAVVVAFPVGVLLARTRLARTVVLGVLNIIYALPSMAVFAVLVLPFGLGFWTAVVALAAYAQMIIVRNVATGITGVDKAIVEAARGSGMSPWQVFWRIERPLAMPVVIAGLRIATVSVIGIGCVAAWIGAGGLGSLIFAGIDQQNYAKAITGALAAVLLALFADAAWRSLETRYRQHVT